MASFLLWRGPSEYDNSLVYEYTSYHVYNVSLLTGETLTTEDLLSVMGMSASQYQRQAREALGGEFWGESREDGIKYYRDYSYNDEWLAMQMLNQNLIATLSAENLQYHVYPYITADGELWIIGMIYDGYCIGE